MTRLPAKLRLVIDAASGISIYTVDSSECRWLLEQFRDLNEVRDWSPSRDCKLLLDRLSLIRFGKFNFTSIVYIVL